MSISEQRGDEVRAQEYIPNLSLYNFNNRINSCCFTGRIEEKKYCLFKRSILRNMDFI